MRRPAATTGVTLQTQDPAGVSSCDFTELLEDEFDAHRLIFVRLRPAVDGDSPLVQVSQAGTFVAGTGYAYHVGGGVSTGTGYSANFTSGGGNFLLSHAGVGFEPGQEPFNGVFEIYGCRLATAHFATCRAAHGNINGSAVSAFMGGLQNVGTAIDGLRFKFGGGNITSGRIVLQGLRRQK